MTRHTPKTPSSPQFARCFPQVTRLGSERSCRAASRTSSTRKRCTWTSRLAVTFCRSNTRRRCRRTFQRAQELELAFLAALSAAVKETAEEFQIDYKFSSEKVVEIGHQAVLWYLSESGKVVSDPTSALLNILNAEKLLEEFLKKHPLPKPTRKEPLTEEQLMDLLPHALFTTLNAKDEEVRKYLRGKADLLILHGFLQATPDVQEAC